MDFGIKPWIFKAHDLTQYSMTFNQALKEYSVLGLVIKLALAQINLLCQLIFKFKYLGILTLGMVTLNDPAFK